MRSRPRTDGRADGYRRDVSTANTRKMRRIDALRVLPTVVKRLDTETAETFIRYRRCAFDLRRARLLGSDHSARMVSSTDQGVCFPPLDTDASTEAFESLCVRFRRLRNQNGDPQFGGVKNQLARCIATCGGTQADRDAAMGWVSDLHSWHVRLEREWAASLTIRSPSGILTPADAIDLVFNGDIFHRTRATVMALSENLGWRWTLIGPLYHQIDTFSSLYCEMAQGIDTILGSARLTCSRHSPAAGPPRSNVRSPLTRKCPDNPEGQESEAAAKTAQRAD
jgi:hypothetical protein